MLVVVYSCFEKGCPTPETVRDDAKGTMGYSGSRSLIEALGVSAAEGNITNKSIYAFSFLVGKQPDPQSSAKLFLPIIPTALSRTLLRLCGTTFVEIAVCHCSV